MEGLRAFTAALARLMMILLDIALGQLCARLSNTGARHEILCYSNLPMKPAQFRYARAESADHAVELLSSADGAARILAGGQSLIPALSARTTSASLLIDIMRCPNLSEVSSSASELTI